MADNIWPENTAVSNWHDPRGGTGDRGDGDGGAYNVVNAPYSPTYPDQNDLHGLRPLPVLSPEILSSYSSGYVDNSSQQIASNDYHQHQASNSVNGLVLNSSSAVAIPTTPKTSRKHSERSSKSSSFPDHKAITYASSSGPHQSNSLSLSEILLQSIKQIVTPQPQRQRHYQHESTSAGSSPKSEARHRESSAGGRAHKSTGGARRSNQKKNSHSTKSSDRSSEKVSDIKKQQSSPVESSMGKTDAKDPRQSPLQQHNPTGNSLAHRKEGQGSSVIVDDKGMVEEPEDYYRSTEQNQGQKDQLESDPDQSLHTSSEVEYHSQRHLKHKQKAAELKETITTLRKENDTLRDLLSKEAASKSLMSGMGTGKCFLQDSDIIQQWKQLAWWIRQCVHVANDASKQMSAEGTTSRSRQVDDHRERPLPRKRSSRSKSKSRRETSERGRSHSRNMEALITITPYYDAFLHTDEQRIVLAEAAIWKTLLERGVFTTSSTISRMEWAGSYAHSMRPMLADCFERCRTSKEFHGWRCHTSTFLSSLTSADDMLVQVNPAVEVLKSRLKLIFDFDSAILTHDLKNVVLNAFKLDKQLCQQQALWYCADPSEDAWASPTQSESGDELSAAVKLRSRELWFDDKLMTVTDAKKEKLRKSAAVTLIICPALIKAGDSYGDGYDVQQIQAKSEVVISRNVHRLASSTKPRSSSAQRTKPTSASSSKVMLPSSAAPTSGTQSRSASGQYGIMDVNSGMMKAGPRVEFADMSGDSSQDSDDQE